MSSITKQDAVNAELRIDRVLVATTAHMPDLNEDISPWAWGESKEFGMTWIDATEEGPIMSSKAMPLWLQNLCFAARQNYGCNYVLLDANSDQEIPGLPLYEHP